MTLGSMLGNYESRDKEHATELLEYLHSWLAHPNHGNKQTDKHENKFFVLDF